MKKFIVFGLSLVLLAACKKEEDVQPSGGGNPVNNPTGNVIPEAVGQWLHGTFAMADYWAYDGSYVGNPFSQSVAFDFKSDGTYEMYYAGETTDFSCVTNAFSYFKGYTVFTESSFIVHPQQGRFRGYYSCTPQYNFDRPAAASELHTDTFYYHFETDANSQEWMVVGFTPNDSFPSYFKATNW